MHIIMSPKYGKRTGWESAGTAEIQHEHARFQLREVTKYQISDL